jgi:uncharacterized protein YkwD
MNPSRRLFAAMLATSLLLPPASATAFDLGKIFGRGKNLAAHEVSLDTAEAVRIISDYRRKHGLSALKLDDTLTRIATDHAVLMARMDKVDHVLRGEGSFTKRLASGGYDAAVASENIGGGYDTLDEAFAGWRRSKEHNKNMLRPDVTVMGIARADSAGSKYGTYWSLVLAAPYEGPPPGMAGGPTAGPIITIRP